MYNAYYFCNISIISTNIKKPYSKEIIIEKVLQLYYSESIQSIGIDVISSNGY